MAIIKRKEQTIGDRISSAIKGTAQGAVTGIELQDKLKNSEAQRERMQAISEQMKAQSSQIEQKMKLQAHSTWFNSLGTIAKIEDPKRRKLAMQKMSPILQESANVLGRPFDENELDYMTEFAGEYKNFQDSMKNWAAVIQQNPDGKSPVQFKQEMINKISLMPEADQKAYLEMINELEAQHANKVAQKEQAKQAQDLNLAPSKMVDGKITFENLDLEKQKLKIEREKALNKGGKELSANMVKTLNEGNTIPSLLNGISTTIEKNKDLFGPAEGRARGKNPYDTRAQTVDAEMRASSQAFGRFMEGGVLRKEDEEKYRKMFPSVSDTPDVARAKLEVVDNLLRTKQESDLKAFKAQGYDLTGLELPEKVDLGQKPKAEGPSSPKQTTPQRTVNVDVPGKGIIPVPDTPEARAQIKAKGWSIVGEAQVNQNVEEKIGMKGGF